MFTYKITFLNEFKNLKRLLIFSLMNIAISLYFIVTRESTTLTYVVFWAYFLFGFIPVAAIHLNYYFTNKYDELSYDPQTKQIIFIHKNQQVQFTLENIMSVTLYESIGLKYKSYTRGNPWDDYNYAVLKLNDGTEITITSLMTGGEVFFPVMEDIVTVKTKTLRWVRNPSLMMPNQ